MRRVNEKLVQSEKLKSDFLSNIKNEINNPITSVLGLVNQIIVHPQDIPKIVNNVRLIFNEVHALDFQMKNIFAAAEIEAGKCYPHLSQFNVNELIEDLVRTFEHHTAKRKIKIRKKLNANDLFVSDREKLEMILRNLLSNAIKFSGDQSEVTVGTVNTPNGLLINIQDHGVGVKAMNLKEIYDRFKQLDSGTTKAFSGHGLGLSIVHSLLEALDATFKIESEEKKGTRFEVMLSSKSITHSSTDHDILFDLDDKGEIF